MSNAWSFAAVNACDKLGTKETRKSEYKLSIIWSTVLSVVADLCKNFLKLHASRGEPWNLLSPLETSPLDLTKEFSTKRTKFEK